MVYLYQYNGIYYIGWTDGSKRRRQRSLRTRDATVAQAVKEQFEAALESGPATFDPPVSLAELWEAYLGVSMARLAPGTLSRLRYRWRAFIQTVGNVSPAAIAPADIQRHMQRRSGCVSRATVLSDLRHISPVFGYAVEQGWLPYNPVARVRRGPMPQPLYDIPAEKDVASLLARLETESPQMHGLVMTALYAGLRRAELVGLRWQDVDFEAGLLYVRGPTKTYRERAIPIHQELRRVLSGLERGSVFVFPSPTGLRWHLSNLDRRRRKFGVPGFHGFRHLFATRLLRAGVDLETVRHLMGHESVRTTMRYLHVVEGAPKEAIEKLPSVQVRKSVPQE